MMDRRTKWLIGGLVVSVALNLIFLGTVIGGKQRGFAGGHHGGMHRNISPEVRKHIRGELRERHDLVRQTARKMYKNVRELRRSLKDDNFDQDEFVGNLDKIIADMGGAMQGVRTAIIEVVSSAPPERRAETARAMLALMMHRSRMGRWMKNRHGDNDGRGHRRGREDGDSRGYGRGHEDRDDRDER